MTFQAKRPNTAASNLDLEIPSRSYATVPPASNGQYQQLVEMSKQDIVLNTEPTLCHLCDETTSIGLGVVLVDCLHTFCKGCLTESLLQADTVRCPYPGGRYECVGILEDRELVALLSPNDYRALMERQIAAILEPSETSTQVKKSGIVPGDLDLLVVMTDASVVPNPESFECPICFVSYEPYEGVILRDCFHCFCRDCLVGSIKHADDVVVKCPFKDNDSTCESVIQDREIRTLLSAEEYNAYLGRSLQKAESLAGKSAFHCKTPDCIGWCLVEEGAVWFDCPVCQANNCLRCKALHAGMDCEEYRDRLSGNFENRRSERALQNLVATGEGMLCPKCKIMLTKVDGCDSIQCSVCKTFVCWATRGFRWGPAGRGDNSGGCRCNMNGIKCHPSCSNCH